MTMAGVESDYRPCLWLVGSKQLKQYLLNLFKVLTFALFVSKICWFVDPTIANACVWLRGKKG